MFSPGTIASRARSTQAATCTFSSSTTVVTFRPLSPASAILRAASISVGAYCGLARIRNSSFPALTSRSQMSSASCGSTVGMVTSILSSPSGRIMISLVPDGFTRRTKAGMIFAALGRSFPISELSSSPNASRLRDPTMLIPPRRSTPNLGGHFDQIIRLATNKAINTIAIRPLYSESFKPLVIWLARNQPSAMAAIKSRKTNQPV